MHADPATAPSALTGGTVSETGDGIVLCPKVQELSRRAVTYLEAGYPVHLSGAGGTGKTTMALHVAARLGRPVSLIHGCIDLNSSDLAGCDSGDRRSSIVDNYISSVLETDVTLQVDRVDRRLATACERGHTLIHDDFDWSRAEVSNTLLSILETGILDVPRSDGSGHIVVHPAFRLILTSSPGAHAGVHDTQDALLDRLVTVEVGPYDRTAEIAITAARSGIGLADAERLVNIARSLRSEDGSRHVPTVRSTIALAEVLQRSSVPVDADDPRFLGFAWDIFGRAIRRTSPGRTDLDRRAIAEIMRAASP